MKTSFGNRFAKILLATTAAAGISSTNSPAAMVSMGLNQVFGSGSVAPVSGTTPYSTVVFQDNGDGTVNLTIANPNLTGVESLSGVYLNFNDSKNVGSLNFTKIGSTGTFTDPSSIDRSINSYRPDGDGFLDVLINFTTGSTTSQTFGAGDSITYKLSYTSAISVSDFEFGSQAGPGSGNPGPFFAAAHVQNTPNPSGGSSAWIGAANYVESNLVIVPEVSAAIPAGLMAMFGFGVVLRRRFSGQTTAAFGR